MIGYVKGSLTSKVFPQVLVECHGVGYELHVPMSTEAELPELGQTVCLLTVLVVRADAHVLYGFLQELERTLFRAFTKVSGVGPRMALAILSGSVSLEALVHSLQQKDVLSLQRIPGVGKKTAERILLEVPSRILPMVQEENTLTSEVALALETLGYSATEIRAVVKRLDKTLDVAEGVRVALRHLSGRK